jgi:hypothetical protein
VSGLILYDHIIALLFCNAHFQSIQPIFQAIQREIQVFEVVDEHEQVYQSNFFSPLVKYE